MNRPPDPVLAAWRAYLHERLAVALNGVKEMGGVA